MCFSITKAEDPAAEEKAQAMLKSWEEGDPRRLLCLLEADERVGDFRDKGHVARQGVSFDKYYFESQTYMKGRAEVLEGLDKGIFYRDEDGPSGPTWKISGWTEKSFCARTERASI